MTTFANPVVPVEACASFDLDLPLTNLAQYPFSHAQGAYGQAGVFRWEHLIEMSGAEDLR